MTRFVAIRKVESNEGAARSSVEKRAAAVRNPLSNEKAEQLLSLGLKQVDLLAHAPHVQHSFHKLDYVKSYVIETSNPAVAERARELLEPDYVVSPDTQFTIPMPSQLERYYRRPRNLPTWHEASGVAIAHKNGIMGQGVLVGVLDTGCDADHIELRDKLIDFRYIPLDPASDMVRICRGFDVDGHGTHVCGIIGVRHVGVAPQAELMVASVIESETLSTSLERVVIALNWMMARFQLEENLNKPTIINASLGFRSELISSGQAEATLKAIQQILKTLVLDYDVLPIVAVGNDGPGRVRAPAYFPETLSVGAVDNNLQAAAFSGGGRSPLIDALEPDLVGFGVDIFSSLERTPDGRSVYAVTSGTSMAAPYVAGIAALAAAADPQLQGPKLRQWVLENVLPLDEGADRVGAGLARFVA